jgi:PhzF family phenazine biosynthesis protein
MSPIQIWHIDAFTDRLFSGNPAAVCLLDQEPGAAWMQSVAAEMNLSETAFVRPLSDGFELHWFTPAVEVDLCGHATLASAHALWEAGVVASHEAIRFHTRSGVLTVLREGGKIALDFPAMPAHECALSQELIDALGAEPVFTGRSQFDEILVFESSATVRSLRPDSRRLARHSSRGVIVTAVSDEPQIDFISRFFAPAVGVDEDPVTGSAHCCLGPYWSERLGKRELVAYQASSCGGVVHVRVAGDRVALGGSAVTVFKGNLVSGETPESPAGPAIA